MRRVASALCAAIVLVGTSLVGHAPVARAQNDGFSIEIVEEQVTDTDVKRMDDAKDFAAQERFAEALAGFEAILADAKLKRMHEQAQYELAKTLYKMGAYHAALKRFEQILAVGPKHPFFAQSREWLFFTARKVKDELSALSLIARYAKPGDIPAEYQSELGYALGRYYFLLALDMGAKGVAVEPQAEPKPDETPAPPPDAPPPEKPTAPADDGFNFSDESLGGGDVDLSAHHASSMTPSDAPVRLWLARAPDDDFGFGEATVKPDKKADKKKAVKKPKVDPKPKADKKDKDKKADPVQDPTPVEAPAASPDKPVAKPKHAFDGPKDVDDALKLSLENLLRVKTEFPQYAQATYMKGLVHYARGEFDPAVKEFREVVRMTNPRGGSVDNTQLREMSFFSLARIHYQFEQFRYAIFYYDRIDRDSEQWLDALFESSWAHFRLGEYEKALGNLVTLQSPFFQDEYYPESSILKAITFYENCRYPEARAFLGEFKQSYGGVLQELDGLIGGPAATAATPAAATDPKSAEELFVRLTDLEAKVTDGRDDANRSFAITARLLRLALGDKRVKGYREAIAEVDDEKARLQTLAAPFSGGAVHGELVAAVDVRRSELVGLAGTLLQDKLTEERKFLKDLTSKLVRIQFEITKGEKERVEEEMKGQGATTVGVDYDFTTATDDERLYWPFEGEYWRDELGTYQYTLTKGCRPPEETTITGN